MNLFQHGVKEEIAVEAPPAGATARLVVIVPDVAEPALLASRIHVIARARSLDVLLIGAASQHLSAGELRRRLTLLSGFLQNAGTHVDVNVPDPHEWIRAIPALLREEDLLGFCVVEGLQGAGLPRTEDLAKMFRRPVYAFMDSGSPSLPQRGLAARAAPWLGSVVLVLAFFWLQVLLSQQGDGAGTTGLLIATVPVEIGLIWLCNALLS